MLQLDQIREIFAKLRKLRILVVGDCMVDELRLCTPLKLSQEAPVMVMRQDAVRFELGGAANVAQMCEKLGAEVNLTYRFGDSDTCEQFRRLRKSLPKDDLYIHQQGFVTPRKIRIWADPSNGSFQQLLRIDDEPTPGMPFQDDALVLHCLKDHPNFKEWNAVIVSDYSKGFITPQLLDLFRRVDSPPVFYDPPDVADWQNKYRGFGFCAVPNRKKAGHLTPNEIAESLGIEACAITLGDEGCESCSGARNVGYHAPWRKIVPVDVCGAGDQFIAALTCGQMAGAGLTFVEACEFANLTAGLQVQRLGHTPVTPEEILKEYQTARKL